MSNDEKRSTGGLTDYFAVILPPPQLNLLIFISFSVPASSTLKVQVEKPYSSASVFALELPLELRGEPWVGVSFAVKALNEHVDFSDLIIRAEIRAANDLLIGSTKYALPVNLRDRLQYSAQIVVEPIRDALVTAQQGRERKRSIPV